VPINRQPAHLEQLGGLSKRERIWAVIRRLKTFTGPQLQGELKGFVPLATIRTYLQGLEKAGYIEFAGTLPKQRGPGTINRYKLINDCGIEAPRVRKDGRPVLQGIGREQLWRTIKILKTFTPRELALAASTEVHAVKESEAKRYVQFLYQAGYVYLVTPSSPTSQARYRFNPRKDTGPKPPQVQRLKTLYDPNLGKIVYQEGVNVDEY